jgi:septum formation protein
MSCAGLILASRSPQRRAILDQLGVPFEARSAEVNELEQGEPRQVALRNARKKAAAIAAEAPDALVLAVDTVVALDSKVYGKPAGQPEARKTLTALSGRRHTVIGGICVIERGDERISVAATTVEFRALDPETLDWYLQTGEWRERAGGYAIQGKGAALVRRIEGDYLNVVGLPLTALLDLLPGLLRLGNGA